MAEKEDSRMCEHTGWAKEERQKKELRMCTGMVGYYVKEKEAKK